MQLSILICSHIKREPLLKRMLAHLVGMPQYEFSQKFGGAKRQAEILIEQNGSIQERPKSRNALLDKARGKYCCFVDDDDVVADDYIPRILKALHAEPDICSVRGEVVSLVDNAAKEFELSVKYPAIFTLPSGVYNCFPSHLNPIRTKIAREVRFPQDFREDNRYTERLKEYHSQHTLKEEPIPGILYHYFNRARIQ